MWPSHEAFGDDLASVGPAHHRDSDEPRGSLLERDGLERLEQQRDVVGVGGVVTRVASRVHTRRAAQDVDLEARVVGERGQASCGRDRRRLEPSVALEGVGGLVDVGH